MRPRHTLQSGPGAGLRPSEKMGLEPIENTNLMQYSLYCLIFYLR